MNRLPRFLHLTVRRGWLGWLAALPCVAALAQPLADPTRPPPDRMAQGAGGSQAATSSGLRLILSGPQRQLALYNGQLLRRGDETGEGTLTRVDPREIRLRKDDQGQQLSMHPLVQKIARPAPTDPQPPMRTRETR